jgi:FAD/FMN-containing dehydrogenase
MTARSWGRWPVAPAAREVPLFDRSQPLPSARDGSLLAHGLGRSYGDVALNEGGTLLLTRGLDRYIALDPGTGVLRAEAGVSLDEILQLVVPQGWFLAVTPGTRFITLGGAVANDVHGKNHHRAGSFGCHVRAFELLRSSGERLLCSATEHADWYAATIGGLGLTGLITWVEIQLVRIASPVVSVHNQRFTGLDGYWALDAEMGARHGHSVAWVDCLHGGRGIYTAGDFVDALPEPPRHRPSTLRVPLTPPVSLVNALSLRAFNAAYYHRPLHTQQLQHYEPFFYPLDAMLDWNRIYGRRGFFQYQCVLPRAAMREAATELFRRIGRSGQGSFLAVFKTFGDRRSPGLLSFPRPGATLALDFPNRGAATLKLFTELDAVVSDCGGALYPAKDARMSPELFLSGYPRLHEFTRYIDPAFSSRFWRRVGPPSSAARSASATQADAVRADSSTTSAPPAGASPVGTPPADASRGHAPSAAA